MAGKQNFQMVDVNGSGVETIMHPQTNADQVLTGTTYRVPTIANINDWTARSQELVSARKGKADLKTKIDEIDLNLTPAKLLEAIKQVDGSNSGLDADTVDGKTVDDSATTSAVLWTASKVNAELNKKVNNTQVVETATPNKLLLLNKDGRLQADLVGNANTATTLSKATNVNFTGDTQGTLSIKGGESSTINVDLAVKDNSHNHNTITNGTNSINTTMTDIAEFKKDGEVVSKIDSEGSFTGSASAVNGLSVNDKADSNALWSNDKIMAELGVLAENVLGATTLNEQTGTIVLSGLIKIKYGTVGISTRSSLDIAFNEAFAEKVLFDGYSIASTDPTFVCYKKIGGVSKTGISYGFNKSAVDGTLTWFAVGI